MKYTDEQLSRILGECDMGQLRRLGAKNWELRKVGPGSTIEYKTACCINQAAFNEPSSGKARMMQSSSADWFAVFYVTFVFYLSIIFDSNF